MDDTLAARMRAEYVGDDAIAFEELKPEVRARWERVAAVAKTKPPVTREAIARALEDRWCLPGVPTPYEEADVVLAVLSDCAEDDDTNIAICPQCLCAHDAALAAGGLEPCPMPEYDRSLFTDGDNIRTEEIRGVEDVALVPELQTLRQKVENQRMQLHNLERREESRKFAAHFAGRASDEELEHVFEQGREEGALVNMEGIRAVRARVEAPLLAEIERLDIENRDRAFYVEQFAAVSQERDAARAELAAIRELCNDDDATGALNSVTRMRERHDVFDRMTTEMEQRIAGLVAELAALRQPTPEPIASPDVLERLAELMADEMGDPTITRTPHGMQRRMKAVVAILRAARAYVDLPSDSIIVYRCGQTQIHGNEIAALNSRIRYRVSPPETPNAQMQRCINRKNRRIDTLKAIVKKWKAKATETTKGLPSVQDLHDAYSAELARKSINEVHPTWGSFALAALRPWLREPTGWELDVHPGKPYSGYGEPYVSFSKAQVSIIKDRIRPTFECKECAARPKNVVNAFNFTFDYDTGSWKVINISPEAAS